MAVGIMRRWMTIIESAIAPAVVHGVVLFEGPDAPLYHGRSAEHALGSLRSGAISGRTKQVVNGREVWGVSATRSPRFHAVDSGDGSISSYGRKGVNVFGTCFVLDQTRLRQKFRIIPLDWYATNDVTGKGFVSAQPRIESEEFIIAAKIPLIRTYVTKLLVLGDVIGNDAVTEKITQEAMNRGIPAETIGQSLSPAGGRRWDQTMRPRFR